MILGIIEEGKLKGKRVIVNPREGLKDNEYLVESSRLWFRRYCLNISCQCEIPEHCPKCL